MQFDYKISFFCIYEILKIQHEITLQLNLVTFYHIYIHTTGMCMRTLRIYSKCPVK